MIAKVIIIEADGLGQIPCGVTRSKAQNFFNVFKTVVMAYNAIQKTIFIA